MANTGTDIFRSFLFFNPLYYYRFFFKTYCEEVRGIIMEEISDNEDIVPRYHGKVVAHVEVDKYVATTTAWLYI